MCLVLLAGVEKYQCPENNLKQFAVKNISCNSYGQFNNKMSFIRNQNFNFLTHAFSSAMVAQEPATEVFTPFLTIFDNLETLLTICRPQKVLSAGPLCGPLVPIPQSKCSKRTFMLPPNSSFSFKYVIKATEMFHVKRKPA